MNLVIQRMRVADISAVIELGESTPEILTGSNLPQFYTTEQLTRWIKRRHSVLLTAEVNGQFAGFRIADYNPAARLGYLEMIAVKKEFRGQGVGQKLLEETLQRLKKMGCKQVWCIVQANNKKVQELYSKQGFSQGRLFNTYEKII